MPSSIHDFDFLHGTWRVEHRRLRERLAGCDEWLTLQGEAEVRPVLGGVGNVDSFTFDGQDHQGMTLRLFDGEARVWRIHWADSRHGRLDPPLTGRFEEGVGEFHGDDVHDGRPVKVRFFWRSLDADHASWEQAFSTDGGATWETNWTMRLTRV